MAPLGGGVDPLVKDIIELGVGLTVTSVMLALFHSFAGFVEDRTK